MEKLLTKHILLFLSSALSLLAYVYYNANAFLILVGRFFPTIKDTEYGLDDLSGSFYIPLFTSLFFGISFVILYFFFLKEPSEENELLSGVRRLLKLFYVLTLILIVPPTLSSLFILGTYEQTIYTLLFLITLFLLTGPLFFLPKLVKKNTILNAFLSALILLPIGMLSLGIITYGTPHERSLALLDLQKIHRIDIVASSVPSFVSEKNRLPETLEELSNSMDNIDLYSYEKKNFFDPGTGTYFIIKDYGDKPLSPSTQNNYPVAAGSRAKRYSICTVLHLDFERISFLLGKDYLVSKSRAKAGTYCKMSDYTIFDQANTINPPYE